MAWTLDLLKRLNDFGIDYAIVGGVAGVAHGSARSTNDIDVCTSLDEPYLSKLLLALKDINPKLRMRPDRMRLPDDPARLQGIRNLYLITDLGQIDILGELPGVGAFDDLKNRTINLDLGGVQCRVLDLETLIVAKRAAGRRKDLVDIAEYEAIRQRMTKRP
jgi:predicted nucleotidyltransferase